MNKESWFTPVRNGKRGIWTIDDVEVSLLESMRSARENPTWYCPPGIYRRLSRNQTTVMSTTPMEKRTHWEIRTKAHGHVLINGLGLGCILNELVKKKEVTRITVVELDADLIALVAPYFKSRKVEIVQANALTYEPPKGMMYGAVWHDIWDDVDKDNLAQMRQLHRKYGKRTEWQGSWARYECEQQRRKYG